MKIEIIKKSDHYILTISHGKQYFDLAYQTEEMENAKWMKNNFDFALNEHNKELIINLINELTLAKKHLLLAISLKTLSDFKEIPEKNGWHFKYKFLNTIENLTELNGEYVSMEGVESVLLSLIEYLNEPNITNTINT